MMSIQHGHRFSFQAKRLTPKPLIALLAGVLCCAPALGAGASPAPSNTPAVEIPAAPAPIVTAPSIRPNALVAQAALAAQPTNANPLIQKEREGVPTRDTPAVQDAVPYVLPPDLHPWPLRFREQPPLNALYLSLPSEQEARLLLPGRAADAAQTVRFAVSKYIADSIGMAAQARGRQLDALETWQAQTERQLRQLTGDPWQAYEFSLEARREAEQFRSQLAAQNPPFLARMASDIRGAVAHIGPLVSLMPTYELRMAWYDILVQLKEGLMLYQTQTTAADHQLLRRMDDFLNAHPAVPRPAGSPPPERKAGAPQEVARSAAPTAPAIIQAREPERSKPPVASQDTGSSLGGLVVVGAMLLGFAGIALKLRGRGKKAPKPDAAA